MNAAHTAFIKAQTLVKPAPLTPEIRLHQADEATPLWLKTEAELGEVGLPPPFWAFPWAGGQALARFILDHPREVAGRRVLDFASGSGLVAIAAALAGARGVEANDIDPFALAAIGMNAALNKVTVAPIGGDIIGQDDGWDVVLAGDIAYERDTAARAAEWLAALARRGADVWMGDPGRTYLARDRLEAVAWHEAPVVRDLEDCDVKRTGVFRFK